MSLVISVYAKEAFCDFLLPAINNADTQIILKKNIFLFKEDISIDLENVDGVWRIVKSSSYKFKKKNGMHNSELCHMLNSLVNAPHVGGVVFEDDEDKIAKFFYMMEHIIEERKKIFSGGNYAQYVQAHGVVLPAIVVALDNIGAFREKTDGKYDDKILRLLKEGISYGIYLIVTAGGFSSAEITMKMADNIKTVVCLQMNDKFAYGDALRQNHFDVLPETNVKGRGLVVVGGKVLEFQAALGN